MSDFLAKTTKIYKALQDQVFEPLAKAPLVFDADSHPEQKPYVEVWRMQNAAGEGPYTGDVSVEDWRGSEPHVAETGRPGPSFDEGFTDADDQALMPEGGYGRGQYPFAFETEEHLNKWFNPKEQEKLAALGFKPTKVKARKVWSSGTQAFYEPYEEPQKLAASEKLVKIAKDDTSEVASIAVCNGDAILMGKRRDNERWTLPGGHLDKGEDKFEGAIRELFEEAGIKADKASLEHLGSEDVTTYSGKKKRIHAFRYQYDGERPTTKNDPDKEVYKWEWIDCKDGLPEDVEEMLHSPKNKVLQELGILKKSDFLQKTPLSPEVTVAHDDWTGQSILQSDRERLHSLMMDPVHQQERSAMLRGLAMKVPTKSINGERHYLLHRRHGPVDGDSVTHVKTTSYSTHPKEKMHKILDGGNIHSAWIPESKISYSYEFSLPHHQTEPDYSHGHEGEVIVGAGTYPVQDKFYQTSNMEKPLSGHQTRLAASEVHKSDYGPKGAGLYNHPDNARRKESRTGETIAGAGPNKGVRQTNPSAKQQATLEAQYYKEKSKSNPVKIYTREEIEKLKTHLSARTNKLKASEDLQKPYHSDAQRKWAHTEAGTKALGGEEAVHHWDEATRGKHLPEHVSKDESLDKFWWGTMAGTPKKKKNVLYGDSPLEKANDYKIQHTPTWSGTTITAHHNGEKVGEAHVDKQGLTTTNIHPAHMNTGLANQMHDHAQKVTGMRLKPAGVVGPSEAKYWQNRMMKPMTKNEMIQQPVTWQSSYLSHTAQPVQQPQELKQKEPLEELKEMMIMRGLLTYHPKKGYIKGRRIRNLGDHKPLMRSEDKPIDLIHYGRVQNLSQLDPGMQGTGFPDAAMKRRGKPENPVTYYYRSGSYEEPEVKASAKSRYHVKLDPQVHKLYDLAADNDKLIHQALEENHGAWNPDLIEGKIKNAGYHGYYNSGSALPGAVAMFHPMKVHKEDLL